MEYKCSNCKSCLRITKHPWNKLEQFKGHINEHTPYFVCIVKLHMDGIPDAGFMETDQLECELFQPKNEKIK